MAVLAQKSGGGERPLCPDVEPPLYWRHGLSRGYAASIMHKYHNKDRIRDHKSVKCPFYYNGHLNDLWSLFTSSDKTLFYYRIIMTDGKFPLPTCSRHSRASKNSIISKSTRWPVCLYFDLYLSFCAATCGPFCQLWSHIYCTFYHLKNNFSMKIFSDRLEIFCITPPITGLYESTANSIPDLWSLLPDLVTYV